MLNEKKKIVPKLRQEVKVDIVTSDDIKIYYTRKFQDFTARYIIKLNHDYEHLKALIFFVMVGNVLINIPVISRPASASITVL